MEGFAKKGTLTKFTRFAENNIEHSHIENCLFLFIKPFNF